MLSANCVGGLGVLRGRTLPDGAARLGVLKTLLCGCWSLCLKRCLGFKVLGASAKHISEEDFLCLYGA